MNCKNCDNKLIEGAKFCGKCGAKIVSDTAEIAQVVKTKTMRGARIFIGVIVALLVFGGLGKALMVIINIVLVLIFNIESTEGYANAEATGNILGFIGGAYLANLAYISIAGKDRSAEKKKWYQFAGFMSTGGRTKARPILTGVIIVIAVVALALSVGFDSLKTEQNKAVESGRYVPTDNWISYTNAPDFSVDFPSRPVHDTKTQDAPSGNIKISTYKTADETSSVAYVINVTEFSKDADLADSSGILESSVKISAKNMNGTIIALDSTTNDGYPAISYLVQGESNSRIKGLNILVGQRLYQLLTAYDKPQEYLLQYDKFVNSFQLK